MVESDGLLRQMELLKEASKRISLVDTTSDDSLSSAWCNVNTYTVKGKTMHDREDARKTQGQKEHGSDPPVLWRTKVWLGHRNDSSKSKQGDDRDI